MNELFRELAPVSAAAWAEIESLARQTLKVVLAARKVVDFEGPLGWTASSVNTGRSAAIRGAPDGVEARLRQVQTLVELRVPFALARSELEIAARGAKDADLQPVIDAARKIALAEDRAVFHGYREAGIAGICERAAASKVTLSTDYLNYPRSVSQALSRLHSAGIAGPFALVLGPQCHTGLMETTTPGGYPVMEHVKKLVEGPIVWAPAVDGAAVISMRGGDFAMTVGQDASIGYLDHNAERVRLYLQESFTFRVLAPEAAIPLAYS